MFKIILTGPESSGKTTLCKALSKYFKIPFNKEYAREYLQNLNRDYTKKDLMKIAKKQLDLEQQYMLLDTDLITIKIWSNYKYGNCNKWIINQIKKQKKEKRFYLLCKPDIKWEEDPLRENPNNRLELYKIYREEIKRLNHDYYIVKAKNRSTKILSEILIKNSYI